ncbi:2-dehydropantoate 2-reductase (Ketopantoate reductase) (KPA reductase) (KPR) [Friedmanniomyces endolithicus]|nr:2-dehydropantoate 2-reductase (Ketopantoate reductase) (KPA reductase) (KPR) [Friedmanniomyces endolithicus]
MEAQAPADRESQDVGGDAEREAREEHLAESEQADMERLRESMNTVKKQDPLRSNVPGRIYILGTGSIGKLVAHSLRGIANPPPVTLLLHRFDLLQAWEEGRKEITIQDGDFKVRRGGYEVELLPQVWRQHGVVLKAGKRDVYAAAGDRMLPHEAAMMLRQEMRADPQQQQPMENTQDQPGTGDEGEEARVQQPVHLQDAYYIPGAGKSTYVYSTEPIENLIVTTKAAYTVPALLRVRNRISPSTTICFLQNGMGVIDDVNKQLFGSEDQRPNYMQGIITHGVNVPPEVAKRDPFFAVHAGHGTIALGVMPRARRVSDDAEKDTDSSEIWSPSARYLLRTLTRSSVLCAVGFSPTELLQQQLEKVAVNSVLNPLTSLLDARNGALQYNHALTRTLRLLLAETSLVIRSLPELQAIPNINSRFSARRLESLVKSVAEKTQDNISSMLADVRAGRRTEIEYINGYIVRRGEEVGVSCVVNYAIMQTVIGKAMLTQREVKEDIPMERR